MNDFSKLDFISDCKCNSKCEECDENIYKKIEKGTDTFKKTFYKITWHCKECNKELYSTTRKTIK